LHMPAPRPNSGARMEVRACIMKLRIPAAILFAAALLAVNVSAVHAQEDGIAVLLHRLEQITKAADVTAYKTLRTDSADPERARAFTTSEFLPGFTNIVIQERERETLRGTLPGDGYVVTADV